jgi:hypothetical protein
MLVGAERPRGEEEDASDANFSIAAPKIELPKGLGAPLGRGGKFSANPYTGTTTLIGTSPGRASLRPKRALRHDLGAGNSSSSIERTSSIPSISRTTDEGLSQCRDNLQHERRYQVKPRHRMVVTEETHTLPTSASRHYEHAARMYGWLEAHHGETKH